MEKTKEEILKLVEEEELKQRCINAHVCPKCGATMRSKKYGGFMNETYGWKCYQNSCINEKSYF